MGRPSAPDQLHKLCRVAAREKLLEAPRWGSIEPKKKKCQPPPPPSLMDAMWPPFYLKFKAQAQTQRAPEF